MPIAAVNGISLSYDEYGSGEPVVLVTGTGAAGRVWRPYQVPALVSAGYRVITLDNRGVPPTDVCPQGFTIADMAADVAGLIQLLKIHPCRVVGFSLGGIIVQNLLLAYPELITQAVLMATRGRTDALRAAMSAANDELLDSDVDLPPRYAAVAHALQFLSPKTLNNDQAIKDWLEILEMSPVDPAITRAQMHLDVIDDQLEDCRKIKAQCLVIGFQDDLMVPPHLCREVAEHIPACSYTEIAGCGHYGYIESPAETNQAMIDFFGGSGRP